MKHMKHIKPFEILNESKVHQYSSILLTEVFKKYSLVEGLFNHIKYEVENNFVEDCLILSPKSFIKILKNEYDDIKDGLTEYMGSPDHKIDLKKLRDEISSLKNDLNDIDYVLFIED